MLPKPNLEGIKAYKSFYPLSAIQKENQVNRDKQDPWFVNGTIGEWTTKEASNKGFIEVKAKTFGGLFMIRPTAQGIDVQEETAKVEEIKQTQESSVKKGTLDQISRIEKSINSLRSRDYRQMTYNASLYPLIVASFIAIGFTSAVEFLKMILPEKFLPILTAVFYFLILISITIS